jgi:tRNA U34 2-thiouridine synthase MnmA/TrmU
VVIGPRESLLTRRVRAHTCTWHPDRPPAEGWIRVRHRGELVRAKMDHASDGSVTAILDSPVVRAPEGQTFVVYSDAMADGSRWCLGGGWIGPG